MKKLFIVIMAAFLLVSMVSMSHARVLVKDSSVVKLNEDINMGHGLIFKDLVTIKGNINVKGDVGGDVVAVLGNVHLFPSARIAGDVVSIGGKIVRDEGSGVKGEITEIIIGKGGEKMAETCAPLIVTMGMGGFMVMKALAFLGFIGLSMIIVSFMTRQVGVISSRIEKDWKKVVLWGLLGFVLVLPIAFLLFITIVGIPLIMVEAVLVSTAMFMGYIAVSQLIGKKFTKAIRRPNQPMIMEVMWGLAILFLVDLIPVLGLIVKSIVMVFGFGSAIVTQLGQKG